MVGNEKGVFQLRGGGGGRVSTTISTLEDYIGFKCSTFDVWQNDNEKSWIDQGQSWTMPTSILNIDKWVKQSLKINQTWGCDPC